MVVWVPSSDVTVTVAVPGTDVAGVIETVPLSAAVAVITGGTFGSAPTLS